MLAVSNLRTFGTLMNAVKLTKYQEFISSTFFHPNFLRKDLLNTQSVLMI
eukprot:UN27095